MIVDIVVGLNNDVSSTNQLAFRVVVTIQNKKQFVRKKQKPNERLKEGHFSFVENDECNDGNTNKTHKTLVALASVYAMTTRTRFSGLQKDVFSLYRTILRESAKKDRLSSSSSRFVSILSLWLNPDSTASYARREFRHSASKTPKNDFRTIEYKIRHGYKQVKLLQMPGVKLVSGTTTSS